jgi:hypothetical protein
MLFVFCRRLALPLWATGCVAVALMFSPPAMPFVVVILGIASFAFSAAGLVPHGLTHSSPVPVMSYGLRPRPRTATPVGRGFCGHGLDAAGQDALALGRLDDDGG